MLNVFKVSLIFEGDEFRGFTVCQLDFDSGIGESLELYILGYNFDLYKLFIIRGFMSLVHQVLASGYCWIAPYSFLEHFVDVEFWVL